MKQVLIDLVGLLLLGLGLPLLIWYFATQDIAPLVDFFRVQ